MHILAGVEGKQVPLPLSLFKGEKDPKTADMENLANKDGHWDGPVIPAKHPLERHQGAQRQAAAPSGPPESQCLLLPRDWKSVDP